MSVYGDSYGTYFAQAFAVRHPARVRAVVLDAAFAVDGFDPWGRATTDAIRAAWTPAVRALAHCPSDRPARRPPAARGRALERTPLTGRARDADGTRHRVRLDGAAFAQLVNDASYGYAIYRDLLAAGRAYDAGDPAPLLRLAAEDLTVDRRGAGAQLLRGRVRRGRLPRLPDDLEPGVERRRRAAPSCAAARAQLAPDAFAPFPADLWLRLALRAPARLRLPASGRRPPTPDPPAPARRRLPGGPRARAQRRPRRDHAARRRRPRDRAVPERDDGHRRERRPRHRDRRVRPLRVPDRPPLPAHARAGRHRLRRRALPELHVVPRFPRRAAAAPDGDAAPPAIAHARSTAASRGPPPTPSPTRSSRWWLISGHARARDCAAAASPRAAPTTPTRRSGFRLHGLRFVRDVAVSGRARWERRARAFPPACGSPACAADAADRLAGRPAGTRSATITGRLGGRAVRLRMPAPRSAGAVRAADVTPQRGTRVVGLSPGAAWPPARLPSGAASARRPSRPPTRPARARAGSQECVARSSCSRASRLHSCDGLLARHRHESTPPAQAAGQGASPALRPAPRARPSSPASTSASRRCSRSRSSFGS